MSVNSACLDFCLRIGVINRGTKIIEPGMDAISFSNPPFE